MASIGLKGFWVAKYAEAEGKLTYTNGKKISKAVNVNESRTIDEAKLYADDGLDDVAYAIKEVSVEVTPNGIEDIDLTSLLGLSAESVTINNKPYTLTGLATNSEGSEMGFAYYTTESISGVKKFKVTLNPRVKFKPSESKESKTKGESTEFTTPSYKGTCYRAVNETYYVLEDVFDTEAEAVEFIEEIFGITTVGE